MTKPLGMSLVPVQRQELAIHITPVLRRSPDERPPEPTPRWRRTRATEGVVDALGEPDVAESSATDSDGGVRPT